MQWKNFTLLMISILSAVTIQAQAVLWGGPSDPNSTFSGGLGGWTVKGISSVISDSSKNALWTYTNSGRSQGAYSDQAGRIGSPSAADGAVIFDSDFMDNGGVEGNEGKGLAPSPHSGSLTSPMIDCSTFSSVAVSFYQYFQNFSAVCYLEVSADSGKTWTPIRVNENIKEGNGTARNNRQVIDISSIASGKTGVHFRFVFDGDYYFWMIDDVTLVSLPDIDLAIRQPFYSPSTYAQPRTQICQDTFRFGAYISNLGGKDQQDSKFKVEVLGSNRTTVLFSDSVNIATVGINDDNLWVSTPSVFVPEGLDLGKYFLRWSLTSNSGADFNIRDNVRIDSFEVTSISYSRSPGARGGIRANGGTAYSVASLYKTSTCWNKNDQFFAKNAEFSLVYGPLAEIKNYFVKFYLLKVRDTVAGDFNNFSKSGGVSGLSTELVSEEVFTANNEAAYSIISIPLTDARVGGQLALDPGSRYFLVAEHPVERFEDPATWKYHASSLEKNYSGHPYAVPVIDNAGTWFESWPEGESPVLRLNIEVVTKVDDTPLADETLQIFPNPINRDQLNFELHFDQTTDANITVFDVNGLVLDFNTYKGIQNQNITMNVTQYPAGHYYLRVSTEQGTKTKAFSIVR